MHPALPERLELGHGAVDLLARRFLPADGGPPVPLTQREVDLLAYLAHNSGRMIGRDELAREVWSTEPEVAVRTVDTAIHRLRTKLEPASDGPRVLLGGAGEGLRLVLPSAERMTPLAALPRADGPLVGREPDVARVLAMLASGDKLVVLVGEQGVGKTRLALEVAARSGRPSRLVRLTGVHRVDELRRAIALAIGVDWLPGEDPDERIRAGMVGLLLVLDALDGPIDAAADLVGRWVDAPGAQILGTSSAPILAPTERPYTVPPLDDDDAMALFATRADAAGRAPQPDELDPVKALVARLHGNPFALELAAVWSAVIDPRTVLGRVEAAPERVGVAPNRLSTIDAVLRSAWVLLTAEEQDVLASCAWFPSVFDPTAAAALSDAPARVAAALLALRRKGLVRAVAGKWVELPAEVRAFTRDARPNSASPAWADVVSQRFGQWCLTSAERLAEALADPIEAHELDVELSVAVACQHVLAGAWEAEVLGALGPALDAVGWTDVHRSCLDRALGRGVAEPWLGRLLERRAAVLLAQGDLAAAQIAVDTATAALDASPDDDPVVRAELALDRATLAGAEGRGDEVVAHTRHAADLVRRGGDERAGQVWMVIGANLLAAGDRAGAVDAYLEAVRSARATGSHRRAAAAFTRLANVAMDAGAIQEASGRVGEAESELRVLVARAPVALLRVRGALAELRGDVRLAEGEWREMANLAAAADGRWSQHEARLALARCAIRRGDLEEAWGMCVAAVAFARGRWTVGWVEATVLLAIVYAEQGARVEAERLMSELVGVADEAAAFVERVLADAPVGTVPDGAYLMKRLRYALCGAAGSA